MKPNRVMAALATVAILSPIPGLSFGQTAPAGGNPLSSIFGCEASGGKQAGGAVIGGVLGGLAGNSLSGHERTLGTVLGAAVGAAAGSYIGCKMQRSDADKAEAAARQALDGRGAQNWSNPETGASGSVTATALPGGGPGPSLAGLRLAPGVELAAAYEGAPERYAARSAVNLRAAPSLSSRAVGKLAKGEQVEVIGRVGGATWLLVGRDGVGVGYASEAAMRPLTAAPAPANQCRQVEQSIRTSDGQAQVQRYTACRNTGGDWVIQA
jgi:surface antigen